VRACDVGAVPVVVGELVELVDEDDEGRIRQRVPRARREEGEAGDGKDRHESPSGSARKVARSRGDRGPNFSAAIRVAPQGALCPTEPPGSTQELYFTSKSEHNSSDMSRFRWSRSAPASRPGAVLTVQQSVESSTGWICPSELDDQC